MVVKEVGILAGPYGDEEGIKQATKPANKLDAGERTFP